MEKSINLGKLEYLILNYSVRDRTFWLKVFEQIKPDFFEKKENKQIFVFFRKYFSKYNQLPDIQITETELNDVDPEKLSDVYSDPPDDTKSYIYDKTLNFIKQHMMREALLKSIDFLEKDNFEQIEGEIKKVVKFNLDTSLGLRLADVTERYEKIKALETERIPTGFPQLDSILNGGWGRKELYAVAAPPGIGKCQTYNTIIEIEIDENSKAYKILQKFFL